MASVCVCIYCRPRENVAPEVKELTLTIFVASVAGFMFGGMIGARHAGDRFIAHNHASKFTSVMQAQVGARGLLFCIYNNRL